MGCLGVAGENLFSVFRSLHLPLDAQFWTRGFPFVMQSHKAGLPLATRARKRRSGSSALRGTYRERLGRKFSKSKFFHSFLETTCLHVSCYPVIVSRKYIYGFSKSAPTPRYTILDSRLPPCNAISKGRPPLSNTG